MTADPPFDFTAQPSGDGHFLHIVPTGFLAPGRTFTLRVEGGFAGDGRSGAVADTIRFRTAPVGRRGPPLRRGDAFRLSRLAVPAAADPAEPQPDRLRLLRDGRGSAARVAPDASGEGTLLLWAVSSKPGTAIADRRGAFAFPLQGRYRDDSLLLSQRGLSLTFSFGDVPLRRFDLRMQMGADRRARGASLTAEVFCPEVPVYGPALVAIGLCNKRRDPALERHVHHRALPRARERPPEGACGSRNSSCGARPTRRRAPPQPASAARRCPPTATRLPSS